MSTTPPEEMVTADDAAPDQPGTPESSPATLLEQEGDIAADFLEGLLDIADLDGDIDLDIEGDRAMVSVSGGELGMLVGPEGRVLDALQELARLAVYRRTGTRSRLMLDVASFREERRRDLAAVAQQAMAEVSASRQAVTLAPMSAFERKVVHDAVAAGGLRSESEGEEPQRRVVISPTG